MQNRNQTAWMLLLLAIAGATGCTALSPRKGSLAEYEDARRSIENPVGDTASTSEETDYRPEGATADQKGKGKGLLKRASIFSSKRRNIELARNLYREGDAKFEEAKALEGESREDAFSAAAKKYGEASKNWGSSTLEQDALLMAAESHFFAEEFYEAEQMYAKLVKEYPRNPYLDHVDSRRFEIADYWLKTDEAGHKPFVYVNFTDKRMPWNDTGGHGNRVLENLRIDNPTGKVSDDATMRLAVENFKKGKYDAAADTFSELRMTYPDSEHLFNAQFLELQSLLSAYQGPDYSSVPLTEAEKRVKQIAKIFPQQAREKQQELNEAYSKIRFYQAERIWEAAEYRRKRSENGAAKFHYQTLTKDFADTPFAEEATAKLESIKDEPDEPPQRFKALATVFHSSRDDRPWRENAPASE